MEAGRSVDALMEDLRAGGVEYVEIAFQDLEGRLRSRLIPLSRAKKYLEEGVPVDGFSVGYAPIEDSDLLAVPVLDRPWIYLLNGRKRAFFAADLVKGGEEVPGYPRSYLAGLIAEASEKGLVFKMGVELEFYALSDDKPHDSGFYMASYPVDALDPLKAEFMEEMEANGTTIYLTHHEVGPGQHEFLTPPFDPLTLADFVVFFKKAVASFFRERGITVTFMPKPFQGLPGNGMHLHISAYRDGVNVFAGDPLSEEALHFIGGLLKNARGISVYTNPTVNSYKRLVLGAEAPVYLVWGRGNRSAYIRVPLHGGREATRIELRAPDSSGNIYLLVAAVLKAGLQGISDKTDPGPEYRKNAYLSGEEEGLPRLPSSLMEAVEEAERNGLLPREVTSMYLDGKKKEWREYLAYLDENSVTDDPNVVTDWERVRYLYR